MPTPPLRIGKVTLTVHDLDRVSRFYQTVVGLHRLAGAADHVQLGAGSQVLLELRQDKQARQWSPNEAGLYHTAFLLPSRADLGRWLKYAGDNQVPLRGAADHLVSEAIYLTDPEGNGVEIYSDRPAAGWNWSGNTVEMANDKLDFPTLLDSAGPVPWTGAPNGSTVGHVHLQVGHVPAAVAFYTGVIGFEVTRERDSAAFLSTGRYHHHLAVNTWHSQGAAVRSGIATGLADLELVAADTATLDAVRARAADGNSTEGQPLRVRDPWGTQITVI